MFVFLLTFPHHSKLCRIGDKCSQISKKISSHKKYYSLTIGIKNLGAHRLSLHLFSILFSSIDFAATIKLNYIVLKNLLKSYLGKMTGELSKGYLARVNLQEKGLESAEIILQVNQINPLGNGKYGLIVHDCQNQMKALLNSSMSGLVRGESLIDGTTRT